MEKIIQSLGEFIDYIEECKNKNYPNISEESKWEKIVYRGHANKDWECLPKLFRAEESYNNESNIAADILRRCPNDFEGLNRFGKLEKMQHYGAPTRLLDFTSNPLIALYFACDDDTQKKKDGAVLLCKMPMFYEDDIPIEIFLENVFPKNKSLLMQVNSEKVECIVQTSNVIGIMPELNNERIKNQEGCFALFTYSGKKYVKIFNPLEENNCIKEKVIVPQECKNKILSSLDGYGINKAFVYPELENQIKEICKKF